MPWLPAGTPLAGVDLGVGDELDAEAVIATAHEVLQDLGVADGCWVTTHAVGGPGGRHSAIAVALPALAGVSAGEAQSVVDRAFAAAAVTAHVHGVVEHDPVAGAEEAVAELAAGKQGRAVVYPGCELLVGEVAVEAVAGTAIAEVVSLGGTVAPGTLLHTREHVRPRLVGGRWVLHVQPAVGGTLVPFEDPAPKRCACDK